MLNLRSKFKEWGELAQQLAELVNWLSIPRFKDSRLIFTADSAQGRAGLLGPALDSAQGLPNGFGTGPGRAPTI
jgi:hypothetical protein